MITHSILAKAIYRVTALMDEREPLKWNIREVVLRIENLMKTSELRNLTESVERTHEINNNIAHLVILLELATIESYMAEINFLKIKEAYLNLNVNLKLHNSLADLNLEPEDVVKTLRRSTAETHGKNTISEQLGKSAHLQNREHALAAPLRFTPDIAYTDENEDTLMQRHQSTVRFTHNQNEDKSQVGMTNKESTNKSTNNSSSDLNNLAMLQSDYDRITFIVKKNGWASRGDIHASLKDYMSAKTLQRKLLKLTSDGTVQKKGSGRWCVYGIT